MPDSLDLSRIKQNVAKMVQMEAPEQDIDAYISGEGTTVDAVRGYTMPKNDSRGTSDLMAAALAGAAQGPGRIAASPGEALNLADYVTRPIYKGTQAVAGKIADAVLPEKAAAYVRRAYANDAPKGNFLPSAAETQQLQGNLLAQTGVPDEQNAFRYVPQNPRDKLAYALSSGAASVPVGGLTGAVSGALSGGGSEGMRQVFEGTPLEGPAALAGGLIGGAAPFAAKAVFNVTRPEAVLARHMEGVTPQQMDTAQQIIAEGRKRGVTVTGPEALQQAQGLQTPLSTLQRTVEQSPQGETIMREVMARRPAEVESAGRAALADTFGAPVAPEAAANAAQGAAESYVKAAVKNRTDQTQPEFLQTRVNALPEAMGGDLKQLRTDLEAEIKLTGPDNALGKKLQKFRDLLEVAPDEKTGQVSLGPLVETNRTYADNLYKSYNPLDPENTFSNREVAALTPFNQRLQGIIKAASGGDTGPYATGLKKYQDISENTVNPIQYGAPGRMANLGGEQPAQRVKALADEFIGPTTTPQRVKQLAAQIGKDNPQVVGDLVGARVKGLFDESVRDLQAGPNPWGGAGFVTKLMGNPQARANLQATVESLPSGEQKWAGFNKFAQVMQALGKRKASGSETAINLGIQEELKGGTSTLSQAITAPMKTAHNLLDYWAARSNAETLAKVFTHPLAVRKMQELAILNPASARANMLAAQILELSHNVSDTTSQPYHSDIRRDANGR